MNQIYNQRRQWIDSSSVDVVKIAVAIIWTVAFVTPDMAYGEQFKFRTLEAHTAYMQCNEGLRAKTAPGFPDNWEGVVRLPTVQALPTEQKEILRNKYFEDFIAPCVPLGEQKAMRASFDAETKLLVNTSPEPPSNVNPATRINYMAAVMLAAELLPATLIFYLVALLFVRRFNITRGAQFAGFLFAWLIAFVTALIMSGPSASAMSAASKSIPAALVGVAVTFLFLVAVARRKNNALGLSSISNSIKEER